MDQTLTQTPGTYAAPAPAPAPIDIPHHEACLTLDITGFLLGRASMDDVCQYCVLTALASLHPSQMSIYAVGSDSLFRLVGSFGKGEGTDALHEYSCLDDPHVGAELHRGQPLATFPLVGMRPEQHLNLSELQVGPQVLWPLAAEHRLIGIMHVRFSRAPEAHAASSALAAIAGPIALALDHAHGIDPIAAAPSQNGHTNAPASLMHPSLMGPVPAMQQRPLSVVRWGEEPGTAPASAPSPKDLTSRQLRVLSLMSKGMTNGQIARILAFSESTVRQETMAIYRTLQVKGRAEAVDFGRSHGLIPENA